MAIVNTDTYPAGHAGTCDAACDKHTLPRRDKRQCRCVCHAVGKAIKNLSTAKAEGMEFPPWQLVRTTAAKQERQILQFAERYGLPLVAMDWTDQDLVDRFFAEQERLKDAGQPFMVQPDTPAEWARLINGSIAPERTGREVRYAVPAKQPSVRVQHIPAHM